MTLFLYHTINPPKKKASKFPKDPTTNNRDLGILPALVT